MYMYKNTNEMVFICTLIFKTHAVCVLCTCRWHMYMCMYLFIYCEVHLYIYTNLYRISSAALQICSHRCCSCTLFPWQSLRKMIRYDCVTSSAGVPLAEICVWMIYMLYCRKTSMHSCKNMTCGRKWKCSINVSSWVNGEMLKLSHLSLLVLQL